MTRYIDADKFISWLDVGHLREPTEKCMSDLNFKKAIDLQSTVNLVPVVHAHWKLLKDHSVFDLSTYECSKCGFDIHLNESPQRINGYMKFCPHCGAMMDEKGK